MAEARRTPDALGKPVDRSADTLPKQGFLPMTRNMKSTCSSTQVESNLPQSPQIKVIGPKGRTLDETWEKNGPCTLFGLHVPDFPNLFIIGPCQAGVTINWKHTAYVAGDHISEVVAACLRRGLFKPPNQPKKPPKAGLRKTD